MACCALLFASTAAVASPTFAGHSGSHTYTSDDCSAGSVPLDMCTYSAAPDLWECTMNNALSANEKINGWTVETTWVHMVKDPSSGSTLCNNDTDTWDYCAFGEVVVNEPSVGNHTRYFICGISQVPLKDARLIGTSGEDKLLFHYDESGAYNLEPDDFSNDLTTQLRGDADDDQLHGSRIEDSADRYEDIIYGGAGADELWGHLDDDFLYGEAGPDDLYGSCGEDTIAGGTGADIIHAGGGDDTSVNGGAGDDLIMGGSGSDTLTGGADDDITCGDHSDDDYDDFDDVIDGGDGDDMLWDTDGAGGDQIYGKAGDDVCGNASTDRTDCEGSPSSSRPGDCFDDLEFADPVTTCGD